MNPIAQAPAGFDLVAGPPGATTCGDDGDSDGDDDAKGTATSPTIAPAAVTG